MVIKVFVSLTSGNKEIKKKQEFLIMLLEGKKIDYEVVDITDPTNDEQRQYMREHAVAKEGQKVPLPPQIFNDDQYCGDYECFHESNENEELYEFLKLAPAKNVSATEVTLSDLNGNLNKDEVVSEGDRPLAEDGDADMAVDGNANGQEAGDVPE